MFEYHPNFETPESTSQIWRYMDFVGFVWVLQNAALWFSRADFFEDRWEGAYPEPTIAAIKETSKSGDLAWEVFRNNAEEFRTTIFLNCWYSNPYESAAMWQLYAGVGNSIAVRSTVGRLAESLSKDSRKIHIGKIKYIDYQKDSIEGGNLFSPYLRKRKSFEHESEVRLVLWSLETGNARGETHETLIANSPAGHGIQVDLNQMIESVFISPKATPWFLELVREVLKKYGYEALLVRQSDFDLSPPT